MLAHGLQVGIEEMQRVLAAAARTGLRDTADVKAGAALLQV